MQRALLEFQSGGEIFPHDPSISFSPARVASPGRVWFGRDFRRGDSNDDGSVNLSDALATLNYLFRGGPELVCPDSGDTDDDGRLLLTDAVVLLRAFFLGEGEIAEPWPDCGFDPTEDNLGCARGSCSEGV